MILTIPILTVTLINSTRPADLLRDVFFVFLRFHNWKVPEVKTRELVSVCFVYCFVYFDRIRRQEHACLFDRIRRLFDRIRRLLVWPNKTFVCLFVCLVSKSRCWSVCFLFLSPLSLCWELIEIELVTDRKWRLKKFPTRNRIWRLIFEAPIFEIKFEITIDQIRNTLGSCFRSPPAHEIAVFEILSFEIGVLPQKFKLLIFSS